MKHLLSKLFVSKFSLSFLILSLLTLDNAHGMMKFNAKCPKMFLGTVAKVENSETPFFAQNSTAYLSQVSVHFRTDKVIRGDVNDTTLIQTLKNGPTKFQEGKQYEIEMRENYICSAKVLE